MVTRAEIRGGWVTFAGVTLVIAGILNGLDAIVALTQEQLYVQGELIFGDLTALATALIVIGAIQVVTGGMVLVGRAFGQFLGVMVAGLNGFWHFLFIGSPLDPDHGRGRPDHLRAHRPRAVLRRLSAGPAQAAAGPCAGTAAARVPR